MKARNNKAKYVMKLLFVFVGVFTTGFVRAENAGKDENAYIDNAQGAYILSIDDVTDLALRNNFDIQLAKYDAQIARTQEGVAESIYDLLVDAEVAYHKDKSKRVSTLAGTETRDNDYDVGVSQKLPSGTTVSADLTNNRNWTDSSFANSNPSHNSSLALTVEQELGKNFLGIQDRGNVKITRLDVENSEYTSLDKIEQYIADVQNAYWDLVLQTERIRIEKKMIEQAKRLYDLHQEKIKDGLVESPDLYASEANYRHRVDNLIILEDQLQAKENVLKFLLNITDDDLRIAPKDHFVLNEEVEQNDMSLKTAFENRRDYKKANNEIKAKKINLSINKNNIWPQINLKASLARNGVRESFGDAVTDITAEDNVDFSASLSVSFPLQNTEARSQLKAAELEKAKAILGLKRIERKIVIDVMDQVRNCNVLKESALNRENIALLQSKKLEEEEKRFNQGRSNTDTIIRYQEDALNSEWQSIQSKFLYYSARIDLRKKEGAILNKYWDGEI